MQSGPRQAGGLARLFAAALVALAALIGAGNTPARAQYDDLGRYNYGARGDPYGARQRPVRPRGDPGYRVRSQPRYYGAPSYYGQSGGYYYYYPNPAYREEREVRRPPASERRRAKARPAAPTPQTRQAEKEPEVEPTTFVAVFGDSTARQLAEGLDEAYEENLDVGIEDKSKGDSGLAKLEAYDWPKAINEYLAANPKTAVGVVMLGTNDRQPIKEGNSSVEPLSDRWKDIYRDRVDAVIKAFADRKIPLVWVSAPPVRGDNLNDALQAVNDIIRPRVQRAGGVFVDVWPGFTDEDGDYVTSGPNLTGQQARLRTSDGVGFTSAGARKAAHFVETELKPIFERKPGTAVAAIPGSKDAVPDQPSVEQMINASIPALPEPEGMPPTTAKPRPLAGPVVPLTRPELSPDGALASGGPKLEGDAAQIVERALRQGAPLPSRPGRADDFRWPPRS